MAPLESAAMFWAYSGVEIPDPMAQGMLVFFRSFLMMAFCQRCKKHP